MENLSEGQLFIIVLSFSCIQLHAQQNNCIFKEPLLKIDFGGSSDLAAINVFPLTNIKPVQRTCPDDGYYSFVSYTNDCFNGDWLTFNEDHTPGDKDGRMMLVNASPEGGVFFNTAISGLHGNTTYELSTSMVNVCRISGGCPPLPPDITIKLLTTSGRLVVSFQTGLLSQNATPRWRVYSGLFTTPADITTLILTMEDITKGGCGIDFALDDITIRECVKPIPPKPEIKQSKPLVATTRPVVKKMPTANVEVKKTPVRSSPLKSVAVTTIKKQVTDTLEIFLPVIKEKSPVLPVPKPISTRANP